MKILITTNTIPDKTGTYIVLKNIIPHLMKNNEVTILTNQCDVDIKCDKLVQLSTSNIFSQYFFSTEEFSEFFILSIIILSEYDAFIFKDNIKNNKSFILSERNTFPTIFFS